MMPKQGTAQNISPFFLTNNNAGKDFYFSFPPAYSQGFGGTNIKIFIASTIETNVTVNVASEGWVRNLKTIPNGVVEVVIPPAIAQTYFKQMNGPSAADQIYHQKAIHITAEDPVIVYGATLFQSSTDAFLVLPTSSLGTEYIVSSYSEAQYSDNNFYFWPSEVLVVAPFDGTEVTFTLGGNVNTKTNGSGKGAGGLKSGQSKKFSMQKGDVLNLSSYGVGSDLSGSQVTANKPIGVVTGVFCANIPSTVSGFTWCNYIGEQEMPMYVWGKTYPVTKIFGRQKNSYIKIVAKEPNTQVFRNGQKIGTLQTAGGTVGKGFLDMRVAEGEQSSFILTSDKPINVTQYNPSGIDDNAQSQSQPFQMALIPMEQAQKEILFSTPGTLDGNDFASHYLNVVFELDAQKNLPADLELAIIESGKLKWEKVAERYGGTFEEINYDLNGKRFGMKVIKLPQRGLYGLRAATPVYAYLYNSGNDSYGCPASALMTDQTVTDTEVPVPVFTQKDFGEVSGAKVTDFPADNTKRSNLSSVYMVTGQSFNYKLTMGALIPGQSREVTWGLTVTDPTKPAKAVIAFIDRAGNDTTITVEFEGVKTAAVELMNHDFGSVTIGNSKEGRVRITSTGDKEVVVTAIEVPSSSSFTAELPTVPFSISPGSYEEIPVYFQPKSLGATSENIVFRMNDLSAAAATVTGTGSKPGLVVTSISFPDVEIGSSSNKILRLDNTGTEPAHITALSTPTVSAFTIPTMPELPLVIEPGKSYDLPVYFEPADTGTYSDDILVSIYSFEVKGSLSGRGIKTPSVGVTDAGATRLTMREIYPNPASEEAVLGYALPGTGHVRLALFNAMGQELLLLVDGVQTEGEHTVPIHTGILPAGMYYCRLMYGNQTIVGSVSVVK